MKTTLANPVLDFINTLCNFVVLNLVFLISCLPVITIGTALSSLYYVTLREARGEYGYLVRTYIKEFRKNLKSGTAAFAVLFVIRAVILFNLAFWFNLGGIPAAVITGLMAVGAIVWLFTFTYTFPLIARFNNSTKQTLINAFCLMMSNVKATLALLLIYVMVLFLCVFLAPMKLMMVLFSALPSLLTASLLYLKRYLSPMKKSWKKQKNRKEKKLL